MTDIRPILLAEDNPNDAELTLFALAESNLANRIVHVRDGVEAMEYLRCEGEYSQRDPILPAVVILDIKMPRMDGIEVLKAIRSEERLKMLPVVMLTSSREQQDIIQSYNLGTNAYVVKPVNFDEFSSAVRQIGVFWALLNAPPA